MTDHPRQQLQHIILHYGRSICDDPKRCEALLRDLCPDNRREINLLMGALREGVASDLLSAGQGVLPVETVMLRLSQGLHDDLGFAEQLALWAVESWAMALGIPFAAVATPLRSVQPLPKVSPPVTAKPAALTAAEKQFEGWQKIGSKGEKLAADALQWAAARNEKSGLMWAVNPYTAANFPNPANAITWHQAQEWVKKVNSTGWCGYNNWRLPTVEELKTLLIVEKQQGLHIRRDVFPDITSNIYFVWTSSPYVGNGSYAWFVGFDLGGTNGGNKGANDYVRVVRSGQ